MPWGDIPRVYLLPYTSTLSPERDPDRDDFCAVGDFDGVHGHSIIMSQPTIAVVEAGAELSKRTGAIVAPVGDHTFGLGHVSTTTLMRKGLSNRGVNESSIYPHEPKGADTTAHQLHWIKKQEKGMQQGIPEMPRSVIIGLEQHFPRVRLTASLLGFAALMEPPVLVDAHDILEATGKADDRTQCVKEIFDEYNRPYEAKAMQATEELARLFERLGPLSRFGGRALLMASRVALLKDGGPNVLTIDPASDDTPYRQTRARKAKRAARNQTWPELPSRKAA